MIDQAGRGRRKRWAWIGAATLVAVLAVMAYRPLAETVTVARLMLAMTGTVDAGPPPTAMHWSASGRTFVADLYRPDTCARAALALIGGIAPKGKDDTRLVAFARLLASAGFAVLVPDVPSLRAMAPGRDTPDEVAAVLARLSGLARAGGHPAIGVVAISFAVGPVMRVVASGRAPDVRLVIGVGGYHDIAAVVTYFTTGAYRPAPGDPWRRDGPNHTAAWTFLAGNAARLGDSGDRALVAEIARRRLADPDADVSDIADRLVSEGRAVVALVDNRDPDRVPDLLAAVAPWLGKDLAALDLASVDLAGFPATTILVHGTDDRIIPASESVALAAALPPDRVTLFLPSRLNHVRPDRRDLASLWTLTRAARTVLHERDRLFAAAGGTCFTAPGSSLEP